VIYEWVVSSSWQRGRRTVHAAIRRGYDLYQNVHILTVVSVKLIPFYELGIFRDSRVIHGTRNRSVLRTPNQDIVAITRPKLFRLDLTLTLGYIGYNEH